MTGQEHSLSELQRLTPTPSAVPLGQDRELLEDFLHESEEHLRSIEGDLLEVERDAGNIEVLHSLFRSFHTMKGIAGFLDLVTVRNVTHEVECLLDLARKGNLALTASRVDVVLAAKDFLGLWSAELRHQLAGGLPPTADASALITRIQAAQQDEAGAQLAALATQVAASAAGSAPAEPAQGTPSPSDKPGTQASASSGVKVDLAKLDFLVDMVGEMMIAQSLVRHHPLLVQQQDAVLNRSLSQLARITSDLQKTAMSMRMVPIGNVFRKMVRLVRDLSRRSGKSAVVVMEGESTELDRNVVEELADPLMHMVRNAVDHGLETTGGRHAAGKAIESRITLSAMHQSGCIVVEVSDDGRGLDRDRILQKAVQNGLVAPGTQMSDADVFHLIFHPGFSTAEQVTDVSGRGVGMDVVKRQIQKLRGRIEIQSRPGKGTTFRLKLPLTLAIVEGLVVRLGTERFILPIHTVREMLRPTSEMIYTLESRVETMLVRGEVIPLVRLGDRLGLPADCMKPEDGVVVLLESEERRFGLLVDELIGKQEVVIKNLGEVFSRVSGLAGGAILGDGRVALILDPEVILRRSVHADN